MRHTVERELKLVPGEAFDLADLGDPLPPRVFQATYHDTSDLRLARHSITLRRRTEDGTGLWQLKIPNGAWRIELEEAGGAEKPPAKLTDLLVVHLRDQELMKVARMRTRRQIVLRDGAEIVEDSVSVFDGRRVVRRFRELEVELLDGDERSLKRLERRLLKAGAEPSEFRPKLFRALDFSPDPGPAELAADAPPGEALGHALVAQYRQLVDHDPGTRLGTDPEDLHQMRVATRRARAFLRAARELVEPEWAEGLRTELGWLGSLLGPARDADVLHEHLSAALAALGEEAAAARQAPLLRALERERNRVRRSAVTALSRKRYFALLDRLEQAERPPLVAESDVSLADLWWDEFKRTRKAFAVLDDDSPDDELHAARIRVKRARYSAELAAHELGSGGERFVSAAKKLQDVLGEHQDAVVAEEWLTRFGDASPASEEIVALLVERERKRRRKARRGWPDAWDRLLRRARQARR
jgi:CHAD domain-containing protein